MMEEINGQRDIQKLFEIILGTKVKIKDNIDKSEEKIFEVMIEKLILSDTMEHKLMEHGGIDAHKLTDPLWAVIEDFLTMLYGNSASAIIMWYILDRKGSDGKVVPLQTNEGKKVVLNTPKDLWDYIKFKSSPPTN